MKTLDLSFWTRAIGQLAHAFAENEGRLCDYDGAIGDGDHGTSMLRGVTEACRSLKERPPSDLGDLFRRLAEAFLTTVGGVTGVVFGALFEGAAQNAAGTQELATADLHRLFQAALEAVKRRGKASEGDKSLVDALSPAVTALATAAQDGKEPAEALSLARLAAASGLEATRSMPARVGRARYQQGKGVGHLDAGAASIALIFETLALAADATSPRTPCGFHK